MAKVKAKPTRIDEKMIKLLEDFAKENEISQRLASRKMAEKLELLKFKDIKF